MLTGTPLDLTPFGPLLSVLGMAYWALVIGLSWVAFRLPKKRAAKATLAMVVFAAFVYPVARHLDGRQQRAEESRARFAESMALFRERCKTAGEKIHRTVENVDGIVWMKWREEYSNADNFADQWKLNDPYGRDCGLEDCIGRLLRVTVGAELNPRKAEQHGAGYRFVETTDPRNGQRYRYTASLVQYWNPEAIERHKRQTGEAPPPSSYQFSINRVPIAQFTAHYGVTWDDISTKVDRAPWIAGSSLKVIDLQSGDVVAERIGYMIDRGQGSQAGGRSPWLLAVRSACPGFPPDAGEGPRGRTLKKRCISSSKF